MKNNIGLFLAKRAHISPNVEAYVDADTRERYTFAELNLRCNQCAHALTEVGVKVGDRVALLMMNGNEFVEAYFAIAKIGAVVVPLNWRLVADELTFILKDSGSTTLIYGGQFANVVKTLHDGGAESTHITTWIHVGDSDTRDDFGQDYKALLDAAPTDEPTIGAEGHDLLYIMYTSGTTGLPKGAVHTHETATWACITLGTTTDQYYKDRYLLALPLYHVGALAPLTSAVHQGVTCVVMPAFDPTQVWELIQEERITSMLAVPAMLNFMMQVPAKDECDFSTLRWIMSGAAPVPVTFIEAYDKMGIEIHQVYGLTETCGPACLTLADDAIEKAGSTGKAFFHTDVRVVDSEDNDVAPDEPGEVIVAGKHIMKEYWNRPEATAETIRDGWLYTGDVAVVDKDGFIYIQDRTKDMIISGGENVYPAEIENVILQHPEVAEVAVIGLPSDKWGESPLAVVVRKSESLAKEEIIGHCKGKLAPFKLPKEVEFVDEIPRNPTGKILKRILREEFPGPAAD
ncbi:MAG TPA: o-succinylbenzoate--CoA ligase [Candidatus Hydrogenedentes bacterium]|nr:o-succinylbenzoate--CoA ligase [Candidatus Hydrogenedentota bacterium]